MLRRVDRFLAPVVWAAAALTVVLLLAGPSLIGAEAEKTAATGSAPAAAADGKEIFASNCGSCHTLARADTNGSVGPNLDDAKPDAATVKSIVSSGKGTMPAFDGTLSGAEIDTVAAFVAGVEPAAATPEATATPDPAGDDCGYRSRTGRHHRGERPRVGDQRDRRDAAALRRRHRPRAGQARWRSGVSRTTRSSRAAPSGLPSRATTPWHGSTAAR